MSRVTTIRTAFVTGSGVLALSMALVAAPASPAQDSEKLLGEVKAAWEKRQNAVRSLKVSWKSKSITPKGALPAALNRRENPGDSPPTDTIHEGTGELILEGKKARVVVQDAVWNGSLGKFLPCRMESAFDGKRFTRLMVPETLWPMATISKDDHNVDADNLAIWPIMICVRGHDRNLAMSGMYFEAYTEARRVVVEGEQLIELIRPRNETRGEARTQVDPARAMSVRRVESYDRLGNVTFRVTIAQAKAASDDIGWLPEKWKTWFFLGPKQLVKQTESTVTAITANPPIAEGDFKIQFPPNTRVTDTTDEKIVDYIAKEDGTRRDILPEERRATHEELVRTNTGDLTSGASSGSLRRWAWLGGAIVIGAIALAYFAGKFRGRTPRPESG